jgi:nitrile hydratase beta subunit
MPARVEAGMDGVHDLGGMQGFSRVQREAKEPAFHAPTEPAIVAMVLATLAARLFNIDAFRHAIERMEPTRYLSSTTKERYFHATRELLLEKGIMTAAELEARESFFQQHPQAAPTAPFAAVPGPPPGTTRSAPGMQRRAAERRPTFQVGDRVMTRDLRVSGHTRLPRYARRRRGVIAALRGVWVLPDANAHDRGEDPQPLYSVRFEGEEIWGATCEPNQVVFLDLWESYLQRTDETGE